VQTDEGAYDLTISGRGEVNGTGFAVAGTGRGNARDGRLTFEVGFDAIAADTDPFANVLAVLILPTGLFGRERDGAQSLLTLAPDGFTFTQQIAGDGVAVSSHGDLTRHGDAFAWMSVATGDVALRGVERIDPCRVAMLPAGPGSLVETVEWTIHDAGGPKRMTAVRHFSFPPHRALRETQLRDVAIAPRIDAGAVALDITSTIRPFTLPEGAEPR
jgi:hypothetical protein